MNALEQAAAYANDAECPVIARAHILALLGMARGISRPISELRAQMAPEVLAESQRIFDEELRAKAEVRATQADFFTGSLGGIECVYLRGRPMYFWSFQADRDGLGKMHADMLAKELNKLALYTAPPAQAVPVAVVHDSRYEHDGGVVKQTVRILLNPLPEGAELYWGQPAQAVSEPEYGDGHDWEGFPGGCARFGCTPGCNPITSRRDTAPPAQAVSVLEGWKLVPIEPTEEMEKAADLIDCRARVEFYQHAERGDNFYRISFSEAYRAMLAAAPSPEPHQLTALGAAVNELARGSIE